MPIFDTAPRFRLSRLRSSQAFAFLGAALFAGCIADERGLTNPPVAGAAGKAGSPSGAGAAGTAGNAGGQSGGQQAAGADNAAGADDVGGSGPGGAPGSEQLGGAQPGGSAGSAGQGGESAPGGVHIPPVCAFHTEAAGPDEGAGGAGGAESAPPTITVAVSPFVGSYLADAAGRTLYTYGADLPGDCNTLPQSLCTADCLVSWPVFEAGARVLPEGLSDAGFGTIQREDGSFQTTYMGWPLYYYKTDLLLGQLTGQGKGKIWHVAEVILPMITIMRTSAGAIKYLADGAGRTLYVSAADQVGTLDADPVSNCTGECLQTFEGFREKNLSIVTVLEPLDFSVFVRDGGGIQVAYKGVPLYRAITDLKSGDMNGTAMSGFTAALP